MQKVLRTVKAHEERPDVVESFPPRSAHGWENPEEATLSMWDGKTVASDLELNPFCGFGVARSGIEVQLKGEPELPRFHRVAAMP